MRRIIVIVSLLSLGPALTACADFDADKLDIFGINEKKKLPGERRALFPEGVPGVTQGVPPDLIKGHQPAPEDTAAVEIPPLPAAEKPKPKPRPRVVRRPPAAAPTRVTVQPTQQQPQQQLAPWPSAPPPARPAPQQAQQAPWPAPAQSQQQQAPSPWPAPPPAGTFSR